MEQKFKKGDLVHIKKDMPKSKAHFVSDIDAIVEFSYSEEYGGDNYSDYSLFIKGIGSVAWYDEDELILIERNRFDLKDEWENEIKNNHIKSIEPCNIKKFILDGDRFDSTVILKIFEIIGFNSSFNRNGEYYFLFKEWLQFLPVAQFVANAKSKEVLKHKELIDLYEYINK